MRSDVVNVKGAGNPWDAWKIGCCRICAAKDLQSLFSLGVQVVSDFVERDRILSAVRCPIELVLCKSCGLVQQLYTAPQDFLYSKHYWYTSGTTKTMRDALREVVAGIECRLDLRPGDVVLDIGSNDTTLLRCYSIEGLVKVGVEPARNMRSCYDDSILLIDDFWGRESAFASFQRYGSARVITSLGNLYDLPDPNIFIADVARSLRMDGMFVAQLMCLRQTLDQNDVGNLCHEHLEFYSLKTLERLYAAHGLEIFDVEENGINGGSYRIWARLKKNTLPPRPDGCLQRLQSAHRWEVGYDDPRTYQRFYETAQRNRRDCLDFIHAARREGKRVWWYGASTKSSVLVQWYGLDVGLIEAAADKSTEKVGKFMAGCGIPIKSCEEFRAARPDYAVVGPYAFLKEFIEVERQWLRDGGCFLVPLPSFRAVRL